MSIKTLCPRADHSNKFRGVLPEIIFILTAMAFAWYFAHIRLSRPEWEPVAFEKLIAGTAALPMQYRTLIPWISRLLVELPIPFVEHPRGLRLGFEVLSLFALAVIYRAFLGQFLKEKYAPHLCSLLLFLVLPYNLALPTFAPWYYVYDTPSVLFFSAGLLFLYRRQWILFYLIFTIGTFNRETTCFLTTICLLTGFGRGNLRVLLSHCLAQFAIWMIIKCGLAWSYGTVQGSIYCNMLNTNLHSLASLQKWLILLSSFGYTWVPLIFLWHWIDDIFVRRACLVVPFFILAMLNAGVLQEIRIFGELVPLVLAAYICILRHLFVCHEDDIPRESNNTLNRTSGSRVARLPESG